MTPKPQGDEQSEAMLADKERLLQLANRLEKGDGLISFHEHDIIAAALRLAARPATTLDRYTVDDPWSRPASNGVREALDKLADRVSSKIVQLEHYKVNDCQLDHAATIAEGRLLQANQILQWVAEAALSASPDEARKVADLRLGIVEGCAVIIENFQPSANWNIEALRQAANALREHVPRPDLREGEKVREDQIVVPRALTAENGAKHALIGEFFEEFSYVTEDGEDDIVKVPVTWTTIKAIHKKMVEHFAALAQPVAPERGE